MKPIVTTFALATSALAAPTMSQADNTPCTFGTYRCTTPNTGIEVCDIGGRFEMVGDCPKGTDCQNLPQNGFTLPFCTNQPTVKARDRNRRPPSPKPGDKCQTPGKYQCFGNNAIQVCDVLHILELVGNCPPTAHCAYINNIPYCVVNGF
ncbi:hypothetical protein C8A05DRAFT_16769 [Staphylotrichum tortipilum]|uniref:Uncharacterized protein n=1 Tax=Staphylotrichum tortipilum TaxID=2831512 RepID=A0AAN6RSM1_9PEZI|nr:hypothetical protein C8A05DRAFT_16769 [Staphylotrichum longicolle]